MSIELMSVAIGALGSIVSVITFVATKKAAKFSSKENTFVIKNNKGESREITIGNNQSTKDISKVVSENIKYEKLIEAALRKNKAEGNILSLNNKHELGYDFLLTTKNTKYIIEAKANKKAVNKQILQRILKAANQQGAEAVVLSKSGFDKSAIKWLKQHKDEAKVKLFKAKNKNEIERFTKTIK
jgi:hypothetical protein